MPAWHVTKTSLQYMGLHRSYTTLHRVNDQELMLHDYCTRNRLRGSENIRRQHALTPFYL